jgi:cell division protein FtsB
VRYDSIGKIRNPHPQPTQSLIMKILIVVLFLLIAHLQYRLWFGDGSVGQILAYQQRLDELKEQVEEKKLRNEALYAEVVDLRKGQEALEERARDELGMIKDNETFFQVIE